MRRAALIETAGDPLATGRRVGIGRVEALSVVDAWGTLGALDELFPGVPAAAWDRYRDAYPLLFGPTGTWRLPFGCFLIRGLRRTILVDAGVGPRYDEFELDGRDRLLEAMAAAGIAPAAVDTVFLTHLHADHVGWIARSGRPAFPHAGYVTHRRGWAWLATRPRSATRQALERLARAGVLELIDRDHVSLAPGIDALSTPGHAPGHMSLHVRAAFPELLVLGDVAVHPAQLDHPDWAYAVDEDPEAAAATRRRLLPRLLRPNLLVACGHYPGGIGRLVRTEDGVRWRPYH